MNARRGDLPERLLDGEATSFERRVLEDALQRRPSAELTRRMAQAIGVDVVGAPPAPPVARSTSTAAPAAASAPHALWPWISAAVVALSVTGVVIGTRARGGKASQSSPAAAGRFEVPADSPRAPSIPAVPPGRDSPSVGNEARPSPVGRLAGRSSAGPSELRGEIELLDGARAALAASSPDRALENVRRYERRYPTGTFAPEAIAVKVEALMRLGRAEEARRLAARFVAEHRGDLLADRIAALAGLPRR